MEKQQIESCRKKVYELTGELVGIFGEKVMSDFTADVGVVLSVLHDDADPKSVGYWCNEISKLLADLSISDTKVSRYRDILKKDFDDCITKVPSFIDPEYVVSSKSFRSIFPNKILEDLEKFVNVCKGFIVDEDAKAQSFHNELIKACNGFNGQVARFKNDKGVLLGGLHFLCRDLIRIIKSRKKSSIISKLTSKSSSYLKNIVKNAENLDKSMINNKPEEKYFDALVESIKKTIDAGKKMKQRRKEHYPILSYPDVQEAFNKVIKIVSDAKKKMLDKKD